MKIWIEKFHCYFIFLDKINLSVFLLCALRIYKQNIYTFTTNNQIIFVRIHVPLASRKLGTQFEAMALAYTCVSACREFYCSKLHMFQCTKAQMVVPQGCFRPVFLNRRTAARYRALASILPGHERFSWNLSF